ERRCPAVIMKLVKPSPSLSTRSFEVEPLLLEVADVVNTTLDLETTLRRVAELVRKVIDYEIFAILLLNEQRQELYVRFQVGYPPEVAERLRVKVGQGVTGRAAETRQPVLVADTTLPDYYIEALPNVQSELAIPLIVKNRVIGVIDLEAREKGYFTEEHKRVLTLIASRMAVASKTLAFTPASAARRAPWPCSTKSRANSVRFSTLTNCSRASPRYCSASSITRCSASCCSTRPEKNFSTVFRSALSKECTSSMTSGSASVWSAMPRRRKRQSWCPMSPRIRATSRLIRKLAPSWPSHLSTRRKSSACSISSTPAATISRKITSALSRRSLPSSPSPSKTPGSMKKSPARKSAWSATSLSPASCNSACCPIPFPRCPISRFRRSSFPLAPSAAIFTTSFPIPS